MTVQLDKLASSGASAVNGRCRGSSKRTVLVMAGSLIPPHTYPTLVCQDHYDFGMRALKSVLVMAGSLKRAHPSFNEDLVLIRAMRDSNIPKFLLDDARLFNAIVLDLFPGVRLPDQEAGPLQGAIGAACEEAGLQPLTPFITKVRGAGRGGGRGGEGEGW